MNETEAEWYARMNDLPQQHTDSAATEEDIDYMMLSADQGDYENAAILAMYKAKEAAGVGLANIYTTHALAFSNLALAHEYRKARR